MDSNNYNDVVYSLYKLSNSGISNQDVRYRQLLSALSGIRSRRAENSADFTSLTGTGQNPFNSIQFNTLLNQIDAYANYITRGLKLPSSILHKCNPLNVTEVKEEGEGVEAFKKNDQNLEVKSESDQGSEYNESEMIEMSDVFHRKSEFWGPGHFWLDYRDNLEQNKLSFFLGAITNVKTMTQYIIQNNSTILSSNSASSEEHNEHILKKFEQLFKDIGLYKYLLTFSTDKRVIEKLKRIKERRRLRRRQQLKLSRLARKRCVDSMESKSTSLSRSSNQPPNKYIIKNKSSIRKSENMGENGGFIDGSDTDDNNSSICKINDKIHKYKEEGDDEQATELNSDEDYESYEEDECDLEYMEQYESEGSEETSGSQEYSNDELNEDESVDEDEEEDYDYYNEYDEDEELESEGEEEGCEYEGEEGSNSYDQNNNGGDGRMSSGSTRESRCSAVTENEESELVSSRYKRDYEGKVMNVGSRERSVSDMEGVERKNNMNSKVNTEGSPGLGVSSSVVSSGKGALGSSGTSSVTSSTTSSAHGVYGSEEYGGTNKANSPTSRRRVGRQMGVLGRASTPRKASLLIKSYDDASAKECEVNHGGNEQVGVRGGGSATRSQYSSQCPSKEEKKGARRGYGGGKKGQIIAKYDFERLLTEILRLEKKINLLLLQKNVKSILNLTRLTNQLYAGNLYSNENTRLEYKRHLMEHIKSTNQYHKERCRLRRKFMLLANKFVYNKTFCNLNDRERMSDNIRMCIQKDKSNIYDNVIATLEESNKKDGQTEGESRIVENIYANLPSNLVGKLRNYQLTGLSWLVSLYNNKLNGILADEMGLGKTIQTIALLIYLRENKGISGPHIILAPMSTIHSNWKMEFETWYPTCKVCIYEGSKEWRKSLRQKWYEGSKLTFDVLLTTDSFILKDRVFLKKICWEYLIVDEAHRLKNPNSKLVKVLNQYFISNRRLLLTGTPLQNDLNELWSLLNFIKPQIFNNNNYYYQLFSLSLSSIVRRYDDYFLFTEEEQLSIINNIHKILKPYLLRREKLDVLEEVPKNDEFIICCPMSGIQTRLYEFLVLKDTSQNRFLQLRKICNHPYLYANNSYPCDDMIITSCGKLCMLDLILSRLYEVNHRVLIFSQMTSLLDILEVYLSYRNYKYLRLDGSTTSEKRLERLNLFNMPNSEYFVFILSTKAGSLGINLQTADTVIIYDSDWNPQNDLQAQSRVHRIGQKNKVISLRLITPNTIEENILRSTGVKLNQNLLIIKSGNYQDPIYSSDDDYHLKNVLSLRNEYTEEYGIRCVELLNKILSRSDEDTVAFKYVGYRNFILSPFPLIKHRVIPPFLYRIISSNKRFQLTEGDKLKLNIDRNTWNNLCSDYNIYAVNPTSQCKVNYVTNVENSKISIEDDIKVETEGLKHIITNLSIDYPVEHLKTIDNELTADVFRLVLNDVEKEGVAKKEEEGKRREIINRIINEEVVKMINSKLYREFNDLPSKVQVKDYYDKIKYPISLRDIWNLTSENKYTSLMEFKNKLQLICSNAKTYNGSESILFHKALNMTHKLSVRVTYRVLIELIKTKSDSEAAIIDKLLAKYFNE